MLTLSELQNEVSDAAGTHLGRAGRADGVMESSTEAADLQLSSTEAAEAAAVGVMTALHSPPRRFWTSTLGDPTGLATAASWS